MRATLALALSVLLVAGPAQGEDCVKAVTDVKGDAFAGALAEPSGDLLWADLRLTEAGLEVTFAVDDLDAATSGDTGRALGLTLDLENGRYLLRYARQGEDARADLYRVTRRYPVVGDTWELDQRAPLPFRVDGDRVTVTATKRILADNEVWLRHGVAAYRLRLAAHGVVDALATTADVLVDDATRPQDAPYVFGDCSGVSPA